MSTPAKICRAALIGAMAPLQLVIAIVAMIGGVGAAEAGMSVALPLSAPELRWSPPRQSKPKIVTPGLGYYSSPMFAATQDVIVQMPSAARYVGSDIQINGGRHVRIIGGHHRGRLYWRNGSGSFFVEGLLIDLSATPNRDAIVVAGAPGARPNVYLQNIVVTGVQGALAGVHADIFQPWGPIGNLVVDRFTGDSNYQGFFIRPEFEVRSATFSRVNLRFNRFGSPVGNSYLFWSRNMHGSPARGDAFFPVRYLNDVYSEPNQRAPQRAAAFPPPGTMVPGPKGEDFTGEAAVDGAMTWPARSGIAGRILMGAPKTGDIVNWSDVGAHYRSPGYAAD